jgi:hypothetical protein
MAAGLDARMGTSKDSEEVLKYLSKTYRLVSKHLQENEKPADSTVAAVMSLAIHEDLLGRPKKNQVHVRALYKIVDIRGGLTEFEANTMLLQKIAR